MTRQTFYRNLRKIAHQFNWKYDYKDIRCFKNGKDFCPITAVAKAKLNAIFRTSDFLEAGDALGLSNKDIYIIVGAADGDEDKEHLECRKTLIKSVGLK